MKKLNKWLTDNLTWLVVAGVGLLCAIFLLLGQTAEDGSITLDGSKAQIQDYTTEFIEDANAALERITNQDQPTDEETIGENDEPMGQGFYTDLNTILARREPDGSNDNGLGWQCSKYTAYLATGKREYSSSHTDYGPVNGNVIADWLVRNYGFKYVDTPVQGAIGSGGFNTTYGHTVMYLYSTGANTAMVNDANWTPLKVSTHNMNISGYKWVVPGNYEPTPTPAPTPSPTTPTVSEPVANQCEKWQVKKGDTLSLIMRTCEGRVEWGNAMNEYAKHWFSTKIKPEQSVYSGWMSVYHIGLFAGDVIEYRGE